MVAIQIDEQSYISFAIWIRSTVIYMGKEEFFCKGNLITRIIVHYDFFPYSVQ